MFRPDEVLDYLFTRVGWKQPTESGYTVLTGDNLISLSGRYFEDFHSAVSIRNIKDTMQDSAMSNNDFNSALVQIQKSSIIRVLQGVFNRDQIIEQVQTIGREYNQVKRLITSSSKFVGYKIEMAEDTSYSVVLNSVSLTFDSAVTFKLYCFHVAKGQIWEKEVTTIANAETIVNVTDLVLSISRNTYKQGEFIFGYFQADLGSAKAVNYDTCEFNEALIFCAEGCEAITTSATTIQTTDVVETNLNYGLNLEMSSVRDFTAVICRNPSLFDEAVGLQVACDTIEQIIMSTRSNATERMTKEFAQQLYNDLNLEYSNTQNMSQAYSVGLKNRLKRELTKLNKNFFPGDSIQIITA